MPVDVSVIKEKLYIILMFGHLADLCGGVMVRENSRMHRALDGFVVVNFICCELYW